MNATNRRLAALAIAVALSSGPVDAANILVTSAADDGIGCTLRNAVISANTDSPVGGCVAGNNADAIKVLVASPGTPVTIALTGGSLSVTSVIEINGPGAQNLRVFGGPASRIFDVGPGASLVLRNLTLAFGRAFDGEGGAIRIAGGSLSLFDCVIRDNEARAPDNGSPFNASGGGVQATDAAIAVTRCRFERNRSFGASSFVPGTPTTRAFGGAIASVGGSLSIDLSTFEDNSAVGGSGGDPFFGAGPKPGTGGAVSMVGGSLFVRGSTFAGNAAGRPGSSAASQGGAVYIASTTGALVENSTFSANIAHGVPTALGGALRAVSALTLRHSTLTANSAPIGAGVSASAALTLDGSLVAGNGSVAAGQQVSASSLVSVGFNVIGEPLPQLVASDLVASDPRLWPLGDFGGITRTHALHPDSPAAERRLAALCDIATDQRERTRPQGIACDSGAFEGTLADVDIRVSISDQRDVGIAGAPARYVVRLENAGVETSAAVRFGATPPVALLDVVSTCIAFGTTCPAQSPIGTASVSIALPAGAALVYLVDAQVSSQAAGSLLYSASAGLGDGNFDANPGDEQASDITTIVPELVFANGLEAD